MHRKMQRDEARKVIASALWLAKERVVGELDEKEITRERLADLMIRMKTGAESPPSEADLTEALGSADDEVREAIEAWSQGDAPAAPDRDAPLPVRPQAGPPVTGNTGLG